MKKFFLHTLFLILTGTLSVAQQFPPTFGSSVCTNCAPTGYTISSGSPSISDPTGVGGQSQKAWGGSVPNPPSYTFDGNTKKTFVSLESSAIKKDKIKTTVGGFVAGYEYTLRYFAMSSRTSTGGYATEAELQVVTLDAFPAIISSRKTTFVPGSNVNIWIEQEINFKATASQLSFVFSGSAASGSSGFVNFDVSKLPFDCTIPGGQVQLFRNSVSTIFPCEGINLYNLVKSAAPVGSKVVWRTSDNYSPALSPNLSVEDASHAKPAPNKYWAFYATDEGCKNVYTSTAGVDVKWVQTQVPLKSNKLTVNSPAADPKGDLTSLLDNPVAEVRWFTSPNPLGASLIANPKSVSPGVYYACYYKGDGNCYSLDLNSNQSTAKVTVEAAPCNAGSTPVTVKSNSGSFYCQEGEPPINLNDFVIGTPPPGTTVLWFNNDSHAGTPVTTAAVDGGNYYAYYYDSVNDCYSPASKAVYFVTKSVPLLCGEDGCDVSTGCPQSGINLNVFHQGSVPDGWELRWFNNKTHSGEPISNPTSVTTAGDYFAFYYHLTKQCYNRKEVSTIPSEAGKIVTITNQVCNSGPQLDVRVALQGAIQTSPSDAIMRADLQTYFGNSGLLPTTSPYGDLTTCPEIGDPSKMNSVVDWVKVEVRDAVDPSILLESKSLILWASGFIGNTNGTSQPFFTSQPKPVRIVIKHRNHLAIMSNSIQDFSSGVVTYDFTTSLSQASNEFGDPVQMIQVNGFWCMPSADINAAQDFVIDGKDGTFFNNQFRADTFDSYDRGDLNMDGVVDGVDGTLFNINFYLDIFSTLINY